MSTNLKELKKIKIGAVSYLNTKPLLYGIKQSSIIHEIELIEDYPANLATMLMNNEIDVGLVPVAIIPHLIQPHIISDYCIGANGNVASVCLFSETDLDNIETILLDYQSRTSVALCKVLVKHYWEKSNIVFKDGGKDFRNEIKGTTAGVIIGDRALEQRQNTALHIYDLAEEWLHFTQLPFVFAAWVTNKKLDDTFIENFNKANALGIENIDKVVAEENYSSYNLHQYYTQNISYILDEEKRKGLQLFLEYLKTI